MNASTNAPLDERGDLRALTAAIEAADHERHLAHAQALPDRTLRFGYTYDRFVVSGNQIHSVGIGLSLPLPLFDRGQAVAQAARARAVRLVDGRSALAAVALSRGASLRRAVSIQRQLHRILREQVIPQARAMIARIDQVVAARALPIGEVILARRTRLELMIADADSLADGFTAALDLVAELPGGTSA